MTKSLQMLSRLPCLFCDIAAKIKLMYGTSVRDDLDKVDWGEIQYYQFHLFSSVRHGIFTRKGGVSQSPWSSLNLGGSVGDDPVAVRTNHERVYTALRIDGSRACSVWQIHSARVIAVQQPLQDRHWIDQADGMITDRSDTPLVMRFADCVPLFFWDPVVGVVGMSHAGWRGTVAGIAANTIIAMAAHYGCKPHNIRAGIGPSISQRHYQVGEEVVAAVNSYFGEMAGLICRDPADDSAYLDLWEANRLDLERVGVEQIEIAGICTAHHLDEFFSHRAEHGQTGRFGAALSL